MTVQDWLGAENQIGIDIWEKKYRYGDESFDQWLDRVSGGDPELRQLIVDKKFLFGGRILANRGLPDEDKKITYSNCYVIEPPEDNIESIFDCAKKLARTYSYGGGCGIDISKLAPKGARVRNAAKESSGAVSFMDLYSMVTGLISQNGRRGALMISMDVDHPDIEDFIDIKKDHDRVTKANISVKVDDTFMQNAEREAPYTLYFHRNETGEEYDKQVNARDILHHLAENNWDMGEPGVLFWDRIKNWNLLSGYDDFEYAGVNPCAEEPLPSFGSCLLGSINLAAFVDENGNFDFDELHEAVFTAVVALNRVLDEGLPKHPLQEQRDSVRDWRQIGLGVMAIGDMLIKMGVEYGSVESLELCAQISKDILNAAVYTSANLALSEGPFPKYDYDKLCKSEFYQYNVTEENKNIVKLYGLRNSQLLTIAPTGTISTMIGVSGGIEPIFATHYTRKTESLHGEDKYYTVYTPIVKEYMQKNGLTDVEQLPDYFVTAQHLAPMDRIAMQGVWQVCIDASISSTVNLPEEATVEDIECIYIQAWQAGLKGITVFRDNCRRTGILTTEKPKEKKKGYDELKADGLIQPADDPYIPRGHVLPAGDNLIGKKRKLTTGCGSLHCTAFFDPKTGKLMETYLSRGSTGGCANSYTGLSRMISLAARAGVELDDIVDQLNSCGVCPSYAVRRATKKDTSPGACCPIAVGKALKEMQDEMIQELKDNFYRIVDLTLAKEQLKPPEDRGHVDFAYPEYIYPKKNLKISFSEEDIECMQNELEKVDPAFKLAMEPISKDPYHCPECGDRLVHEGGCDICKNCGWSKCN